MNDRTHTVINWFSNKQTVTDKRSTR